MDFCNFLLICWTCSHVQTDIDIFLGSVILNDFFKPIAPDMDRLKSIKKHRIGRRSKQLERYEQKMKEERQKRIRERQKEFFSEIEVHRSVHCSSIDCLFLTFKNTWFLCALYSFSYDLILGKDWKMHLK